MVGVVGAVHVATIYLHFTVKSQLHYDIYCTDRTCLGTGQTICGMWGGGDVGRGAYPMRLLAIGDS